MSKKLWMAHSRAGFCAHSARCALDHALRVQNSNDALHWCAHIISAGLVRPLLSHLLEFAISNIGLSTPDVLPLCLSLVEELGKETRSARKKKFIPAQFAQPHYLIWQHKVARLVKQLAVLDKSHAVAAASILGHHLMGADTLPPVSKNNPTLLPVALLQWWSDCVQKTVTNVLTNAQPLLSMSIIDDALRTDDTPEVGWISDVLQQLATRKDMREFGDAIAKSELEWIRAGSLMEQATLRLKSGTEVSQSTATTIATLDTDMWMVLRTAVGQSMSVEVADVSDKSPACVARQDCLFLLCKRLDFLHKLYMQAVPRKTMGICDSRHSIWILALLAVARFSTSTTILQLPNYNVELTMDDLKDSGWNAIFGLHDLTNGLLTNEQILSTRLLALPLETNYSDVGDFSSSRATVPLLRKWQTQMTDAHLMQDADPLNVDDWESDEIQKSHCSSLPGKEEATLALFWQMVLTPSLSHIWTNPPAYTLPVDQDTERLYHQWAKHCISDGPWKEQCDEHVAKSRWVRDLQPWLVERWPTNVFQFLVAVKVPSSATTTVSQSKKRRHTDTGSNSKTHVVPSVRRPSTSLFYEHHLHLFKRPRLSLAFWDVCSVVSTSGGALSVCDTSHGSHRQRREYYHRSSIPFTFRGNIDRLLLVGTPPRIPHKASWYAEILDDSSKHDNTGNTITRTSVVTTTTTTSSSKVVPNKSLQMVDDDGTGDGKIADDKEDTVPPSLSFRRELEWSEKHPFQSPDELAAFAQAAYMPLPPGIDSALYSTTDSFVLWPDSMHQSRHSVYGVDLDASDQNPCIVTGPYDWNDQADKRHLTALLRRVNEFQMARHPTFSCHVLYHGQKSLPHLSALETAASAQTLSNRGGGTSSTSVTSSTQRKQLLIQDMASTLSKQRIVVGARPPTPSSARLLLWASFTVPTIMVAGDCTLVSHGNGSLRQCSDGARRPVGALSNEWCTAHEWVTKLPQRPVPQNLFSAVMLALVARTDQLQIGMALSLSDFLVPKDVFDTKDTDGTVSVCPLIHLPFGVNRPDSGTVQLLPATIQLCDRILACTSADKSTQLFNEYWTLAFRSQPSEWTLPLQSTWVMPGVAARLITLLRALPPSNVPGLTRSYSIEY